jgi:hypothetical protein
MCGDDKGEKPVRAKLTGLIASASAALLLAPSALACRVPDDHRYIMLKELPAAHKPGEIALEVEPLFDVFSWPPPGQMTVQFKVTRVVAGRYDKDTIEVWFPQTSCTHLRSSEKDRLLVGSFRENKGRVALSPREEGRPEVGQ